MAESDTKAAPRRRPATPTPPGINPAAARGPEILRLEQVKDPDRVRGHANALMKENRVAEAIEAYEVYLGRRPLDAGTWCNLGVALRKAEHFEASELAYRRALEVRPGDAAFLGNLGNVLKDLDRLEESLEAHKAAVAARPDDLQVLFNYGLTLREASRFEEAIAVFEKCCAREPENVKFHWDRALALLHLGRMKEGWEAYHWRWKLGELPPPPYKSEGWTGQDLTGKSILLFPEQGFGDTILAVRFAPLLKAAGAAEVVLECKPPLRRLFSRLEGVDRMIEPRSELEGFDYHCSVMGLLERFQAGVGPLPPPPRLTVPEEARRRMETLLAPGAGRFKVGVIWSGSVTFKNNRKRAVGVERFLDLAGLPGVQLFSLQKGPLEGELREVGAGALIRDLGSRVEDFAETAAAIQALDLVVMTDSSVAHLAGSLGRPVWNLLNYTPYWIYRSVGAETAWYPSMRLFRQPTPGDWDAVFAEVRACLAKAIQAKQAGRWPAASKTVEA